MKSDTNMIHFAVFLFDHKRAVETHDLTLTLLLF